MTKIQNPVNEIHNAPNPKTNQKKLLGAGRSREVPGGGSRNTFPLKNEGQDVWEAWEAWEVPGGPGRS